MNSQQEALGIESTGEVGLEGAMFSHNWVTDPTGKELLDAIRKAGKGTSSRGTSRAKNSAAQSLDLQNWLHSRRKLYEKVVDRYDGAELQARIGEAQLESDGINRAGDEFAHRRAWYREYPSCWT